MKSEIILRREGCWTSFISRRVNRLRCEIVSELGGEPTGTKRAVLESVLQRYGVLLVMGREFKNRELMKDGALIPMLGKQYLAWEASFERSLATLVGNGEPEQALLDGVTAIEPRFKTTNGNGEK